MAIPVSQHHDGMDGAAAGPATVAVPEGGGTVTLPSASFIADGQFVRDGNDLAISDTTGNGIVVRGYFAGDAMPDLMSPDGSQILTAGLIESFLMPATPGQYAQAAPVASAPPIGQVTDLDGNAFAIRADGTRVHLANGDAVYEGDIVETGGTGSAIRMIFTDKTEFSLGADARLALDQLVFNPDTQTGAAQFSVLKGVFIFASGQIAKTDNTDMTVITPVATIGIRGTEVAGRVSAADSQFTVIDGAIEVTTQAGSVTLDDRGETTLVAGNDMVPSEPAVLAPADFGKAYGEIAGVASTYFGQGQPGMQDPAPGGTPAGPGAPEPESPPADPGDRTDGGTAAPEGSVLAGILPSGILDPAPLAATLADETTVAAVVAAPLAAVAGGAVPGLHIGGPVSDFLIGTGTGGENAGAAGAGGDTLTVTAFPGITLADNLTFSPSAGPVGVAAGFDLLPSGDVAAPVSVGVEVAGVVQVAFTPAPGEMIESGAAPVAVADGASFDSPPLDQLSTGSSGSPFRGESGSAGANAGNPYVTTPFGYFGPQLGDPVFDLVAGGQVASGGPSGAGDSIRNVAETFPVVLPALEVTLGGTDTPDVSTEPESDPVEITLTVSHATDGQQYQDMTFSYELPDHGPESFVLVPGNEIRPHVPNVSAGAAITLQRGDDGGVEVALTSAWDSIKNIRADSTTAADITIENFVHADVAFGDGGDSHITIRDAKRGFIETGNGNDTIEIEAYSNGAGWSHTFDVRTGEGDDTLVFDGAMNGLSRLYFDGGDGMDRLILSGPGQSFSLLPGNIEISGVERIDISGAGNTTLTVPSNLLDHTDMLVVDGDAGDILDLHGGGWSPTDPTETDVQGYTVYEHASGMKVAADIDLHVTT